MRTLFNVNNTNATALKLKQQTYNSLLVGAVGLITPTSIVRKLNIKVACPFRKITVIALTYNEAIKKDSGGLDWKKA